MKVFLVLLVILFASEINAYQEKTEPQRNQLQYNRFFQLLTQNNRTKEIKAASRLNYSNKETTRHIELVELLSPLNRCWNIDYPSYLPIEYTSEEVLANPNADLTKM